MKTVKDYNNITTEFAKTQTTTTRINSTVLFYQVCADTLSKQSKARQNMGAGYAFFAYQTS